MNPAEAAAPRLDASAYRESWAPMAVPGSWKQMAGDALQNHAGPVWYRCAVRVPAAWREGAELHLELPSIDGAAAWWNGHPLTVPSKPNPGRAAKVPADWIEPDDANLLVLRIPAGGPDGLLTAPAIMAGDRRLDLRGRWQFRAGDEPSWSNLPLPAKFGAPADIYFEAK